MFFWNRHKQGTKPKRAPQVAAPVRPQLEGLEQRCVMSGNVIQSNLISDVPGLAAVMDPNLVNPWGISQAPGGAFWVSDNGSGLATLYQTSQTSTPPGATSINPLVVTIPTGVGSMAFPATPPGSPTGQVFNSFGKAAPGDFDLSANGKSAAAVFLFATEDGTISGWNPGVEPTNAVLAVDNSASGAVYKGLAEASVAVTTPGSLTATEVPLLYAANFRDDSIDVFNGNFQKITTSTPGSPLAGNFVDNSIPAGYAPYNIQELNGQLYVTYALQDAAKHDDVAGAGHGFVDVFNNNGTLDRRLASKGVLNSPWGLATVASGSFDGLTSPTGAPIVLVGNFGNGEINTFDSATGKFLGALKNPDGSTLQIGGLWGLEFGTGGSGGLLGTLYFSAGVDHETHGLFGSLTPTTANAKTVDGNEIGDLLLAGGDKAALRTLKTLDSILDAESSTLSPGLTRLKGVLDTIESDFAALNLPKHTQPTHADILGELQILDAFFNDPTAVAAL